MRAELTRHGALASVEEFGLVGITDLMVHDTASGQTLFAVGRGGGWLNRYDISSQAGGTELTQQWQIAPAFLQLETTDLVLRDLPGNDQLFMAGLRSPDLQGVNLASDKVGSPITATTPDGSANTFTEVELFADQTTGVAALRGGGLALLTFEDEAQIRVDTNLPSGPYASARATDLATLNVNGENLVITSHRSEDAIVLFRVEAGNGLSFVDDAVAGRDLWLDRPGDLALTTASDGVQYVVVASAGSDSLTTLAVTPTGLTAVDHVIDTLQTRFADASHVTSVSVGEHHFILAAGSDSGLSLMTMLPGGRLQNLQDFAGDATNPLRGITDVEAVATPNGIRFWVSTESAPYISEFSISLEALGLNRMGTSQHETLIGTGQDDVLAGDAGDDHIEGQAGDDLLLDGSGQDTLTGGAGADVFIFTPDETRDTIQDFEPGKDVIDLSSFGTAGGLGAMTVSSKSWGAELRWGDEVLEVRTAGGTRLTQEDFDSSILTTTDRITPTENQVVETDIAPSRPIAALAAAPPPVPSASVSPFCESSDEPGRFAFSHANADEFVFRFEPLPVLEEDEAIDPLAVDELADQTPEAPVSEDALINSGLGVGTDPADDSPFAIDDTDAGA